MNREIHKIYDFVLKVIMIVYGIDFLRYIGEERKISKILKTELIALKGDIKHVDFLCELEDGTLCHLEFQFPVAYLEDLKHFYGYNILIEMTYNFNIADTIIVNFTQCTNGVKKYNRGSSKEFKPKQIYLGDTDYLEILENIKSKVDTNIKLTSKEEIDLMLMSLLPKYTDKTTMFKEIINIIKKEELFNKDRIKFIKYMIQTEIKNLISVEDQKQFEGELKMSINIEELFTKTLDEIVKEHEDIVRAEEKEKIAKKLKNTLTPEEISKITGLSLKTILLL